MGKFEDNRSELKTLKEKFMKQETLGKEFKKFEKKFDKLFEGVSYDILTSQKNRYYGNFLANCNRRKSYVIAGPYTHQVSNTGVALLINPLLVIDEDLDSNVLFLKHEVVHIIGQHYARIEELKDKYPKCICLLASDLVANKILSMEDNLDSDKFWVEETLDKMFEIKDFKVKQDDTVESVTARLYKVYQEGKYPLFNAFVDANKGGNVQKFIEMIQDMLNNNMSGIDENGNPQQGAGQEVQGQGEGEQVIGEGQGQQSPGAGSGSSLNPDGSKNGIQYQANKIKQLLSSVLQQMGSDSLLMNEVVKHIAIDAASQSRGILPGGLAGMIKVLNEPPVITWQEHLKMFIASLNAGKKPSLFRRNRRQPFRVDLKGELTDKEVDCWIAIDTSGSVDDKMLSEFMNELFEITRLMKAKIHIIECDTYINKVYEAEKASDVQTEVLGRGGTSFSPVIEYMNENASKDSILIYFTDGFGESNLSEKPKYQGTLWVLPDRKEDLSLKGRNLLPKMKVISMTNNKH